MTVAQGNMRCQNCGSIKQGISAAPPNKSYKSSGFIENRIFLPATPVTSSSNSTSNIKSKLTLTLDAGMHSVDLSPFKRFCSSAPYQEWLTTPGPNYYKLLAYLTKQLPTGSIVADLGTNYGNSAIAMASNEKIKVLTYDLTDLVNVYKLLPNISFRQKDCIQVVDEYINCPLIFLDIDPHDGIQEMRLMEVLLQKNFKGLMLCDDIHHIPMQPFWNSIKLKKIDLTGWGHGTGTGAVIFDETEVNLIVE